MGKLQVAKGGGLRSKEHDQFEGLKERAQVQQRQHPLVKGCRLDVASQDVISHQKKQKRYLKHQHDHADRPCVVDLPRSGLEVVGDGDGAVAGSGCWGHVL